MNGRTVAITGVNGFLGRHLLQAFAQAGWSVLGMCRNPHAQAPRPGVRYDRFVLCADTPSLEGVEVLVHCAVEPYRGGASDAPSPNVEGSRKLFAAARAQGVQRIVFISSTASREDTESPYGRDKREVEKLLDPARDLIIRPGLIVGDGGMFRSMFFQLRKLRAAPLFFGGKTPVYTVALSDLVRSVLELTEGGSAGMFILASQETVTFKVLYAELARKAGVKPVLIPLPFRPIVATLQLFERLGIALPITSGSVRGIGSTQVVAVPQYPQLRAPLRNFCEALDEVQFRP